MTVTATGKRGSGRVGRFHTYPLISNIPLINQHITRQSKQHSTLILRNFPDGAKVFAWRFIDHHAGGKKQRIDYGSYPAVSLEQARHIHGLMTAARKDGKDIMSNSVKIEILKQVLGEDAVKMEARPEGMTLNEVYDKFIKDYAEPLKPR